MHVHACNYKPNLSALWKRDPSGGSRKLYTVFGPNQREECMEIESERGVHKVLEFQDILNFVIQKLEPNKN